MKNRIWKKILAVGVSLLAEAGMLVGCTAQPAVAYGAEMEGCVGQSFLPKTMSIAGAP